MVGVFSLRVTGASSLWLGFLATCCLAWPSAYQRPSYNYYTPEQLPDPGMSQWDIAQEPLSYEQPENYYVEAEEDLLPELDNNNVQWDDVEAFANLMGLYDSPPAPATWGQIVNEEPAEVELEELKHLQKHQPEVTGKVETKSKVPLPLPTVAPAAVVVKSPAQAHLAATKSHQGQKEIPLLRPPNKPKSVEPLPVLAQRSDVEQKPSAYDTLRKYLSIEDALKKDAEKRRASHYGGNVNHQKKRSYVTDEDTLTGQLNNLKKSVV